MHKLLGVNEVTVENKYLILLIADLFDRLGQVKYFTKVDLSSIQLNQHTYYILHPRE